MAGIKFGILKHKIEYEIYIYINAFFIKKLYVKIIYFLLTTGIRKKEKYKFGHNKIWRMAGEYTVQEDCMLYVFMTGDIDSRSISFMYGML